MSNPGYLAIIERHEAFRPALGALIASSATGLLGPALVDDASRLPCITVIVHIAHTQGGHGQDTDYRVLDVDPAEALTLLAGNASRKRFVPVFKGVTASSSPGCSRWCSWATPRCVN